MRNSVQACKADRKRSLKLLILRKSQMVLHETRVPVFFVLFFFFREILKWARRKGFIPYIT